MRLALSIGIFGPGAKVLQAALDGACKELHLTVFAAETLADTKKITNGMFPNLAIIIWDDDDGNALVQHIESLEPNFPWALGINVLNRNEELRDFLLCRPDATFPALQVNMRDGALVESPKQIVQGLLSHPPAGLGEVAEFIMKNAP